MKGVSAVIVSILLILIVISIAGFAFVFFHSLAQKGLSEQTIGKQMGALSTTFSIEGVNENSIYVRNTGSEPLSELVFIVNGVPVTATGPSAILPNQVGTFMLDNNELQKIPERTSIRVSSSSWTSELAADIMTIPIQEIPPLLITDIQIASISKNSAKITWMTNRNSSGSVHYRRSSEQLYQITKDTNATKHSVSLNGLAASTKYFFFVNSSSAGANSASSEYYFTTCSSGLHKIKYSDEEEISQECD